MSKLLQKAGVEADHGQDERNPCEASELINSRVSSGSVSVAHSGVPLIPMTDCDTAGKNAVVEVHQDVFSGDVDLKSWRHIGQPSH